jgi:hypothetical protein
MIKRGKAGNDTLTGGGLADELYGNGGHDRLFGRAGNDLLDGGAGNDSLFGELGDDHMAGGLGADKLWGGDGHDQLFGGAGADVLKGERGSDHILGDAGSDLIVMTAEAGLNVDRDFVSGGEEPDGALDRDVLQIHLKAGGETVQAHWSGTFDLQFADQFVSVATDVEEIAFVSAPGHAVGAFAWYYDPAWFPEVTFTLDGVAFVPPQALPPGEDPAVADPMAADPAAIAVPETFIA